MPPRSADTGTSVLIVGSSDGALYVGPAVNIAIARHVEQYILRECSAALTKHAKEHRIRKPRTMSDRRRVFERMFFCGIASVLAAHPVRNDQDETAQAIERYAAEHFKIRSVAITKPRRCSGADYMGGFRAGENTRIDRPVEPAAEQHRLAGRLALP